MTLVGVRVEVPTNQPIVLLREESGRRHLPIFIGQTEATAIVYALQGMETPRPLTHDLFKSVLDSMAARLNGVLITELRDSTYYAELDLVHDGKQYRVSSRPSDAIALAVRYEEAVPIFAEEGVLDEAGIVFEPEEEAEQDEQVEQFREFLEHVTPEDFA